MFKVNDKNTRTSEVLLLLTLNKKMLSWYYQKYHGHNKDHDYNDDCDFHYFTTMTMTMTMTYDYGTTNKLCMFFLETSNIS